MVGPRRNEESFENDGVGCQAFMWHIQYPGEGVKNERLHVTIKDALPS